MCITNPLKISDFQGNLLHMLLFSQKCAFYFSILRIKKGLSHVQQPLYFCGKLCKGSKVGFEQPVPGALRPAGLQQSCGLLQGRGRIPPSAPSITTQFYIE